MSTHQNESNPQPAGHASRPTMRVARIRWLLHGAIEAFPTLVVLFALVGVGVWGHAHDWRAPKFASLLGSAGPREPEDWCAEHNVPESRCIKCHPELIGDTAKDWCKEHGVPESRCTICHPEILTKGIAGDWCKEHGVPESNCTICHPEIAVKGQAPTLQDSVRVVESDEPEPTSQARKVKHPATCQTHALRVQFASPESVRKAGVQLGSVIERPMAQTVSANAETQYDRTRFAQVASHVPGVVWRVDKEIGESVHKGDVLALVDAAEVGRAKAELLTASAQREVRAQGARRIDKLLPQKISTEAELQEAQAALREAEIRVFNARQALINLGLAVPDLTTTQMADEREVQLLGLPAEVRATLDAGAPSANLVPMVAPLDGVVIQRDVVAGEVVEASKPLFAVADTRRMWLTIDVPQAQIGRVAIGQSVRFQPERSDGTAQGRISWMSTAVDDQTRTVKVRADLENAEYRLLASTFGRARITVRESPTAIAVPNEAIQWEGCCHVVFVRLTDDIFQTRKIRPGTKDPHYTEVLAGLLPGEVVATAGSHVPHPPTQHRTPESHSAG